MPPKRAALVQVMRDAFTDDLNVHVIETMVGKSIPDLEGFVERVRTTRATVMSQAYKAPDAAKQTPQPILALLQQYQSMSHEAFLAIEQVRTVIMIRAPELKEEDNLGVAVQATVVKMLDAVQAKIVGKGGEKDGGPAVAGLFAPGQYLSERAGIEEKILGKPGDDKATGTAAPSALLELQHTDSDALLKVELAALQLVTSLRTLVNAYALNWKKLIQPRTSGNDKMVS